jgi:hypothetical protein
MTLTGKQKAFVQAYLDGSNFNATVAAQMAGYKASSQHAFEAIGSENLAKPEIKAAVDEYFRRADMSAEETLRELAILARGNSKDKIQALALLSKYHGLLDGSHSRRNEKDQPLEIVVKYETKPVLVDRSTREPLIRHEGELPTTADNEVEIIRPPKRALPPAPVERLMRDVPDATDAPANDEPEYQIVQSPPPQHNTASDGYNDVIVNEQGERVYQFGSTARKPEQPNRNTDPFVVIRHTA